MKAKTRLVILLLFIFGFGNVLLAQDLYPNEVEQLEKLYFGKIDYLRATQLQLQEQKDTARILYKKVIQALELEKNWLGYIEANISLLTTYQEEKDFLSGVELGNQAFRKIKKQAPEFRKRCGNLVYHIGLTFPYPYKNKKALERFSYAKNLVKNSPIVDSLLLGKIYSSMGMSSIQLEDTKNAQRYLTRSKELLAKHSTRNGCEYNWRGANPILEMLCDTIIQEDGNITINCVSANPPYIIENNEECEDYLYALRNTYINLGLLHQQEGNYSQALLHFEKGLERMKFQFNELAFANLYHALGKYYFETFQHERSNFFLKKTILIIKESNTQNEYFLQQILPECFYLLGSNYVNIERQLIKYDPNFGAKKDYATIYFEQAINLDEEKPDLDEFKIKVLLSVIDYFLITEDEDLSGQILNFVDSNYFYNPTNSPKKLDDKTQAKYHLVKAELLRQTDQPKQAIEKLHKIFNLALGTRKDLELAKTNFKIAECYQMLEQPDSAITYNHQAFIYACYNFDSTDYFQLPKSATFKNFPFIQEILIQKASLFSTIASSQIDVANKKKYWSHSIAIIDLADKYHEQQLQEINFLESIRSKSLIHGAVNFYLKGIAISHELYQLDHSPATLEKGFYYAQKMKGQELTIATLKSEAERYLENNTEYLKAEKSFQNQITKNEQAIFTTNQSQDTILIDKAWNQTERVFYYQNKLESLIKKLESEHPEYLKTKYAFVPETSSSIRNSLEEDEIIIEYVSDYPNIYIFTHTKNQALHISKTVYKKSTLNHILILQNLLTNSPMLRKTTRKKFIQYSHLLYQQYLLPIQDQLKGKKRLIIIPDEMANYIPFEVLLKSDKIKRFKNLDYLITDFELSYHYSSTLFAKAKNKRIPKHSGIYAFAPVYDSGNSVSASVDIFSDDFFSSNTRTIDEAGKLLPLPMSELEVNYIIVLFQNKGIQNNKLALRKVATEHNLKVNLEKPYRFIHIAGHSFANPTHPNFSGIACFDDLLQMSKLDLGQDHFLFTNEIYTLRTQADLVTLSSCESGYGQYTNAEGLLGLNRAFLFSGTQNVVYSLWKVYDKTNARLMADFYNNILTGSNYSKSLRQAKLRLLKKEATASPHFWAPYLLIGR